MDETLADQKYKNKSQVLIMAARKKTKAAEQVNVVAENTVIENSVLGAVDTIV